MYACMCTYMCPCGLRARSLEGQSERKRERRIQVRRKKEGKRETEAYGRAGGLPGFRQEDVTVNPRPPASDEPTLSASQGLPRSLLLLLLPRARAYVSRLHMHTRGERKKGGKGRTYTHWPPSNYYRANSHSVLRDGTQRAGPASPRWGL